MTLCYWRKKEEHLAWFEDEIYLRKRPLHLTPIDRSPYFLSSKQLNPKNKHLVMFTEEEAKNILKEDFYKFEKVEF